LRIVLSGPDSTTARYYMCPSGLSRTYAPALIVSTS